MKKLNIATLLCGLILFITSCGGSTTPTSVDEGETTSKSVAEVEVAIGKQVWTTKNLDVSKFRNGEAIPLAKTNAEWELAGKNKQAAWCYYDNNVANGTKYGKLYNWYAVNDKRGLAPKGYHIPSDAEWTKLTDYLGGDSIAGAKMKSTSGWIEDGNGSNSSGFNGLPGGYCTTDGSFGNVGAYVHWWSSSEVNTKFAWSRGLWEDNGIVARDYFIVLNGYYVRCIKD